MLGFRVAWDCAGFVLGLGFRDLFFVNLNAGYLGVSGFGLASVGWPGFAVFGFSVCFAYRWLREL